MKKTRTPRIPNKQVCNNAKCTIESKKSIQVTRGLLSTAPHDMYAFRYVSDTKKKRFREKNECNLNLQKRNNKYKKGRLKKFKSITKIRNISYFKRDYIILFYAKL